MNESTTKWPWPEHSWLVDSKLLLSFAVAVGPGFAVVVVGIAGTASAAAAVSVVLEPAVDTVG